MTSKSRIALVCACAVLSAATASATTPVTVSPDPIQFGTVPLNSTSQLTFVFVDNPSASPVTITGMTITGASSANFAFSGSPCVLIIGAGQFCQMYMTFTPSAMGNITATLAITQAGVKSPINIPLNGTGGNPIPSVTSLSPPGLYVNSPSTTITINGSGFLSSTLAYLQSSNTPLPTKFVSATRIKTQIPDTALTSTGDVSLFVTNPSPGGGTASADLQVILSDPSISAVSPVSIVAGTAPEAIVVTGQNFMAGAKVQWNGVSIPTTYLGTSQLQIQPTTSELASAGLVQLTVVNPPPGTISPPTTFNVTYPVKVTILDLPANDLVWDPFAQLLYASLPSSFGANGNTIAAINPTTGGVTGYHFAGSEPNHLALDSTSKYLYVGLDGNGSILRLKLPSFTPDIQISLGTNQNGGPNLAGPIAVSPADPHTIAVALSNSQCCFAGQLDFFTDSTQLANSITQEPINRLAFPSGTTLYGYEQGTLSQITVSSTGGTLGTVWTDMVTGNNFQYSGGMIFGSDGQEFNPATGLLSGTFDVDGNTCCNSAIELLPNSAIKRALALGITPFFNSFGITSYNLSEFTPLAVASLAEFGSEFSSPTTSQFLQWGPSGLAFIVTNSCCGNPQTTQVVLIESATLLMAKTATASPAPVAQSLSPSAVPHGSGNRRMTLRGSGFVPGSVVMWQGKPHSASYVGESEMTIYASQADFAAAGTANVEVVNRAPGGGQSKTLLVTIK